MITTTDLKFEVRDKGKAVARVWVTNVPAWVTKSRTNRGYFWLYIKRLWVSKKKRGLGLGRMLLRRVYQYARHVGANLVLRAVPIADMNYSPRKLKGYYRSFGYRSVRGESETMVLEFAGKW